MHLFAISDLHREFFSPENKPADAVVFELVSSADVIILAGDIDRGIAGITWAGQEAGRLGQPVLYVPGNHEFYGHDHDALRVALRAEEAIGCFRPRMPWPSTRRRAGFWKPSLLGRLPGRRSSSRIMARACSASTRCIPLVRCLPPFIPTFQT